MTLSALDTPAVLIDIDRVDANIDRAQAHADRHGIKLRPHIKTHKLPMIAARQVARGAVGITCQKLGEAEVMADAGLFDIFLPCNILGEAKLRRLRALAGRVAPSVTADSEVTAAGYAAAFADAPAALPVLVECETGMRRCGVQTPAEAVALARVIDAAPGLRFAGLMTYPAPGQADAAQAWLAEAAAQLARAGLPPATVSSGGTPDMWRSGGGVVTEYRPGTYIYLDRSQVARGVGGFDECAPTVLATVVSCPTPDRAVIDAGSKALTSDLLGMEGGRPPRRVPGRGGDRAERGAWGVDLSACAAKPAIGERVRVVPNHACVVSNLFDTVTLVSGDAVVETVPVAARGRVG